MLLVEMLECSLEHYVLYIVTGVVCVDVIQCMKQHK